ncbi:hypothetical protein LZL87_014345 [Fusarium oxysporum]|nr:hypothetical protein LZL87_014345 [Fusarium oxysporum]
MASAQLYAIALERSTQPDLPTEHNEVPYGITRLSDIDHIACEGWLQEMNFLLLDMIEAMTERWPQAARAALNSMDKEREGEERGAFESLAAVYDLGRRRRYQAIWTSLVGFIAHSHDEGMLEEMGMRLTESQINDILDVEQEVWQVDLKAIARN